MKVFFILLLLVFSISAADISLADSNKSKHQTRKGYLQNDLLFNDRVNIHKKDGRKKGYAEQDLLFEKRTNIFDQSGRKKGYMRKTFCLRIRR